MKDEPYDEYSFAFYAITIILFFFVWCAHTQNAYTRSNEYVWNIFWLLILCKNKKEKRQKEFVRENKRGNRRSGKSK